MINAEQMMSHQLTTVTPDTSVGKAVELYLKQKSDVLLVVTAENRLVGLIPDSVMLRSAIDSHLRQDPVSLHVSREFLCVQPAAPLDTIVDQFVLHRLNYLPVQENDRIIGVINRQDVLHLAFSSPSLINFAYSLS